MRALRKTLGVGLGLSLLGLVACAPEAPAPALEDAGSAAVSASAVTSATQAAPPRSPVREGSTVARAIEEDVLFVADEDHSAIRVVPLPLSTENPGATIPLPGRPAQLVVSGRQVLVTVRSIEGGAGALLVLERSGSAELVEKARISLPPDAWGLALSEDAGTAIVTSAWSAKVSVVDLAAGRVRASLDVGREPRGVTLLADGSRAYVSHLVGSAITRIDGISGPSPSAKALETATAPLRAAIGQTPSASLGYSVVASPSGERLFLPRHALGVPGPESWFGSATVDVVLTANDASLLAPRRGKLPQTWTPLMDEVRAQAPWQGGAIDAVESGGSAFVAPRAAVYRAREQTLLVASEGTDRLVELDALMSDPTVAPIRTYELATHANPYFHVATQGGAPSGIALSADERIAYVHCRSTNDVIAVRLVRGEGDYDSVPPPAVRFATAPEDESFRLGKALFYNATDDLTSGGLSCAGCHPDGRDDGHVWHEVAFAGGSERFSNFLGGNANFPALHKRWPELLPKNAEGEPGAPTALGYPRQTPLLAGRVGAKGPYGWHAESPDLPARLVAGFGLHRWRSTSNGAPENFRARAGHLAKFLREGLVPPPRVSAPLTDDEARGKGIFESQATGCAGCHVPATEFSDRNAIPLGRGPTPAGFAREEDQAFKTPGLAFVGGTPPYFHDGRFRTLEDLIEKNRDAMGKTSHLTAAEKQALIAYLRTL
jgi:DNA-binding beta-propeller fold protein YncE/mono/diheme cytochrome c family protein